MGPVSGAAPVLTTDWKPLAQGPLGPTVKETRLWPWSGLACEATLVRGGPSRVPAPECSSLLAGLIGVFLFGGKDIQLVIWF